MRSPTSTRPVTSLGRSTFVGRSASLIIACGAIELPPESLFSEPMRDNSEPSAPAAAMPYIGLCGLLPVSFSERAGMTAPLMLAAVVGETLVMMPRRNALSEWKASPSVLSMKSFVPVSGLVTGGAMSPGSPWRS